MISIWSFSFITRYGDGCGAGRRGWCLGAQPRRSEAAGGGAGCFHICFSTGVQRLGPTLTIAQSWGVSDRSLPSTPISSRELSCPPGRLSPRHVCLAVVRWRRGNQGIPAIMGAGICRSRSACDSSLFRATVGRFSHLLTRSLIALKRTPSLVTRGRIAKHCSLATDTRREAVAQHPLGLADRFCG